MKILYLTISYDEQNNGLYNNLVDALLRNNHSLTIVRSVNNANISKLDVISDYLSILSVETGNPFEKNIIKKGLNQVSLSRLFTKAIKKYLNNDYFDLILYATPPITLYKTVDYCKKKYNAKTFLMLKDIFPQNAVDLEMFSKKSAIYMYFRNQEKKYYEISDYIGCMSQGNINFVKKHNSEIIENKLHIFANSINVNTDITTQFNDNKTVFIFGGNLGKPQNIPGLINVISKLSNYPLAEFIIIGKGTESNYIKDFISNNKCNNLKYLEFLPADEYEKILCGADVGIISLDSRFTIPNIPSKFQSYLKLKKPVFAMTDRNTDIKDMILDNSCGWWSPSDYEEQIVETIKYICEHKDEQITKGENGYNYLLREFDVKDNVKKIEEFMGV